MLIRIGDELVDFSRHEYYEGMVGPDAHENLFRTPNGEWVIHRQYHSWDKADSLESITEEQAVGWLFEFIRIQNQAPPEYGRRARSGVPDWVIPSEELRRYRGAGRVETTTLHGTRIFVTPLEGSPTAKIIEARQNRFLEPGRVLRHCMWPLASEIAATAGFAGKRHDDLLELLQKSLVSKLLENPRIYLTQSLQDRGCDLIIEWPARVKYGVQLKSNGDVMSPEFSAKTTAQIQDSRQHGLAGLYAVLAADITNESNLQKVRIFISKVSCMNDPYVVVVPPENSWNLFWPKPGHE